MFGYSTNYIDTHIIFERYDKLCPLVYINIGVPLKTKIKSYESLINFTQIYVYFSHSNTLSAVKISYNYCYIPHQLVLPLCSLDLGPLHRT